ncbi:hypothetical protein [Hymenobacter segetis]|uniref:Glycosyltransferase RgtA/B/C/D-like domain-containing protein n=1 Tax=Hymenobacter segetis TaxID=2025509 RepID=A0ABU9LSG4_9BACT
MNLLASHPDASYTDRRVRLLLAGLLGLSVVMAFLTKGTYDSGDSIKHYLFAHYAFQHPLNLLDSWAKPLFTLLASGPAQAGFIGMKLFQCVVVAASAWCAYVVARALRLPAPELAILFAYVTPDYFLIQFSGLTEPLFGLILIGSVALAMTKRPGWSAALISWLPFVRSEGFILIGIWVVFLAWRRQWRSLPLLVLGYAVYSVVGGIVFGEPGWVFGHNPYGTVSVYGHGDWNHFLISLPGLLGWVLTVLAALGGVRMLRHCAQPERWQQPLFSAELLLVYGSITVFILAHTIFWAKGLFNSFGLTRVLTVTAPLFAVVALNGLAWLAELGRSEKAQRRIRLAGAVAAVAFLFTGARNAFRWQRDFGQSADQQVAEGAAAWLRQTNNTTRPLAYEFPYVSMATQNDFFNLEKHPSTNLNWAPHLELLPVGTLLIWDDWFFPVEGRLPMAQLQADNRFRQRWQAALPRDPYHPERDTVRVVVFERVR